MTETWDVVVVGGGIVGLGLARAALERQPRLKLLVVEKESAVGAHQTGHNSGVVHTGVYYRPGSEKARLCVSGARRMLAYCRERGLPLAMPGKTIVARTEAELAGLDEIERRGRANGVEGLRRLDRAALAEQEPHVNGIAALHVPTAAIVDYAAVARSYRDEIAAAGGEVRTGTAVLGLASGHDAVTVETAAGALRARQVANCAGLYADRMAALAAGRPPADVRVLPFRGEYYVLGPRAAGLVRGLVYPVPDPRFPFLGVHFTPRVHGGVEAGPNAVLAWRREGYGRFDASATEAAGMLTYPGFWAMAARYWRKGLEEQWRSLSRRAFVRALQGLLPELRQEDALPGGAGVRAQLVLRNGTLMDDFCVRREGRFLHVLNVPSPAATASLAIGEELAGQLVPA
jgi:L-2-hydroxyglutarate oxidase